MGTFNEWWENNKDSHILMDEYVDYCVEQDEMGFKPVSFKQWAKSNYNFEYNI